VTDRRLLYAAAFLRAVATAMMAVLLGVHLAQRGLDVASLGIVIAAGLAGAATASLVVTLAGDGIGRRRRFAPARLVKSRHSLVKPDRRLIVAQSHDGVM